MSVEVVAKIATAREAAIAAGRSPDAIGLWGLASDSASQDAEEAKRDILNALASVARWDSKRRTCDHASQRNSEMR